MKVFGWGYIVEARELKGMLHLIFPPTIVIKIMSSHLRMIDSSSKDSMILWQITIPNWSMSIMFSTSFQQVKSIVYSFYWVLISFLKCISNGMVNLNFVHLMWYFWEWLLFLLGLLHFTFEYIWTLQKITLAIQFWVGQNEHTLNSFEVFCIFWSILFDATTCYTFRILKFIKVHRKV